MNFKLLSIIFLFLACFSPCLSAQDSLQQDSLRKTANFSIKEQNLVKLLELHYLQQPGDGNYTVTVAKAFDLQYAKKAYSLCAELNKLDTLQALTLDIGYIHELREEYDSAFTYYYNTVNLFEEAKKYDRTFSLTQNILYNNNTLYKIIEADKIEQKAQTKKTECSRVMVKDLKQIKHSRSKVT